MYIDFINELRRTVDLSSTVQLDLPSIDLERICQGIRIFGVNPENLIIIKYYFEDGTYEVSYNYGKEAAGMATKDHKKAVKYVKDCLESEGLKRVIKEVTELEKNGEI